MVRGRYLVAVSLVATAIAFLGCGLQAEAPRPNIVIILIDTLRPEFLDEDTATDAANPYLAGLIARSAY